MEGRHPSLLGWLYQSGHGGALEDVIAVGDQASDHKRFITGIPLTQCVSCEVEKEAVDGCKHMAFTLKAKKGQQCSQEFLEFGICHKRYKRCQRYKLLKEPAEKPLTSTSTSSFTGLLPQRHQLFSIPRKT